MATIKQSDFIQSVADALQYISYYHPEDFITNLSRAYELEQSPAAKDAMAQILINSRMCAEGHRPICQDTGIVTAFVKVGMETRWDNDGQPLMTVQQMVDAGVRRAYLDPDNKLRGSILADPAFSRKNTGDNTPSVVSIEMVPGGDVDVTVAAKRAAAQRPRASSSCSIRRTLSSTGSSRRSGRWAQAASAGNAGDRHWRHG